MGSVRPAVLVAVAVIGVATLAPAASAAECKPSDRSTAEQSYSTAYQFVQANQWAEAIPSLEEAVKACPNHWESVELLAAAKMRTKAYAEAQDWYGKLVAGRYDGVYASTDTRVLQPYGFVLLNNRNWPEAERVYEAILTQDPNNKEAHERLVYAYNASKDFEQVIDHLEQLHAMSTGDEQKEYAARIGKTYQTLGDNETAKQWFEMGGGATSGMFQIGVDHMGKKEWALAADAFQKFVEGKPDSAPAWKNLGQCYDRMGDKAKAVDAYGKALEIDASRNDVAVSLGFAYSDLERWNDAARVAQQALSSWSDDNKHKDAMYFLMGKVLEKRDANYEEAISMFEKAKDDPYWGSLAVKEISRQQQLIEIRQAQNKNGR